MSRPRTTPAANVLNAREDFDPATRLDPRAVMCRPDTYTASELRAAPVRPGAIDAYRIPSRGIDAR